MRVFSHNDLKQLSLFMDERDMTEISQLITDYTAMNNALLMIYDDVGGLKADCTIYE